MTASPKAAAGEATVTERVAMRLDGKQVLVLLALIVPLTLLWSTWVVWPLKILVVFFHELSHGFAAMLTGGSIDRIKVVKDQGGVCVMRGGNRFLTLSAGYLGSLTWGGLALLLSSRTRRDRWVTRAMSGLILLATFLWVRPVFSFGFGFHLLAGLVILLIGILLPESVNDVFLKVFGLASCLYVIPDIWSDTVARSRLQSDARMLAELTHVPTVIWGGFWIIAAVALAVLFLAKSCRVRPAARTLPELGLQSDE
jgi:hypothetical protein